jgi:hypothetical protein
MHFDATKSLDGVPRLKRKNVGQYVTANDRTKDLTSQGQ